MYVSYAEAENCEEKHIKPTSVRALSYIGKLPYSVEVEIDGKWLEYRLYDKGSK
jgi:hypothetical protein